MSQPSDTQSDQRPDVDRHDRNRRLWAYFKRYKAWFAAGAVFLGVTNYLNLAIPGYIGQAVQSMRDAVDTTAGLAGVRSSLVDIGLIIIALAVGGGVARVFSRIFIFNAGRHIEFDVRNEVYEKLGNLGADFFGDMATGDITSRSANDISYVRLFFAMTFLHIFNTTIAYAIAMTRMAQIDWTLTLICLAPYPIILFILRFVMNAMFEQTKVVQAQMSDISTKVQENLGGVSVVKSYALEQSEMRSFNDLNTDYYDKNIRLATIRGAMQSLMLLASGVGTLAVLIVGTGRVIDGTMELGAFVEFNSYVVALAYPTTRLGWVFSIWNRGLAAFERVLEIMGRRPSVQSPPASQAGQLPALRPGVARGDIRFEDVSFSYPDDDIEVLDGIDMHLPAGSTVAIVGKTGSGKTTLVKLIARLYDPSSGQIHIDGQPVDGLDLRAMRSDIGFVSQEPFLFSMTIGQNIRFGLDAVQYDETIDRRLPQRPLLADDSRPEVSQAERIEQAVEVAGLNTDIDSFQDGLDTLVGERGVTLSGGQKQRVTIARALLIDPRILILDDALSSVDTQTEDVILDHLDEIMEDRTSIILTHRFNALSRVDTIFVIDDGRIVERGSQQELLDAQGTYYEMCERQRLEESLQS